MTTRRLLPRSRGTLEQVFTGRANSVGLVRLLLASAVVVSHARPLGFGRTDVGFELSNHQTNIGTMGVYGFFVLSGLLITRSARRIGLGRYLWHRAVRILPGLWVCLLVTAFVVAPLVAMHENGSLDGFWSHPQGPVDYVVANWATGVRQYGVSGLLVENTPWGRHTGTGVFNGALWSLVYEMLCYLVVAVLAVAGVLHRRRMLVAVAAVLAYAWIWRDFLRDPDHGGPQGGHHLTELPLLGTLDAHFVIYLGFLFALGACFELYRDRLPINDVAGVLCGVVLVTALLTRGFFVVGLPAYAYFLLWVCVALPRRLHGVGRRNDYSYGVYIYGFVVQQVLALAGAARWGFGVYVLLSLAGAFALAFCSWHLVEKQAMKLKDWRPGHRSGKDSGKDDADRTSLPPRREPQTHPAPEAAGSPQGAPTS